MLSLRLTSRQKAITVLSAVPSGMAGPDRHGGCRCVLRWRTAHRTPARSPTSAPVTTQPRTVGSARHGPGPLPSAGWPAGGIVLTPARHGVDGAYGADPAGVPGWPGISLADAGNRVGNHLEKHEQQREAQPGRPGFVPDLLHVVFEQCPDLDQVFRLPVPQDPRSLAQPLGSPQSGQAEPERRPEEHNCCQMIT
jgi:hypothetical protein